MKFPRKFTAVNYTVVIIIIIITILSDNSINCLSLKSLGSPKVWMNRYAERDGYLLLPATDFQNVNQFENLFASKNGSEYVLSSEVRQVEFACEADYPVTWILPNVEQFSGDTNFQLRVSTERASDFENLTQPRNSKFYAYLRITNEAFMPQMSLSGEVACQMVDNPNVQSSIYVFTESLNIIEYVGQVVQVNVTSSKTPVIIPCRPNLPTISLSLFKLTNITAKQSTSLHFEPMYLNESISFNQRLGFILDKNTLQDIYGEYKCVVDGEEETLYAYFQVVAGTEPNKDFIPRNEITSKRAKLTYGRGFVQCCTSSPKSPADGDSFVCNNAAECAFFKPLFMYDVSAGRRLKPLPIQIYSNKKIGIVPPIKRNPSCYRTNLPIQGFHQSKLFLCSGLDIDVVAHFVTAFTSVNYSTDTPAKIRTNAVLQKQYDVFDLTHNNNMTISNKIRFEIEAPLLGLFPPQIQFSQFWNQHGQKFNNFYTTFSTHPLVTLSRTRGKQNRLIRKKRPLYTTVYRDNLFEGESLLVTCRTHPFFYSRGGWLRLNWKNGTHSVFPQVDLSELTFARGLYYYGDSLARIEILNAYISGHTGIDYIRAMIPRVDLEMKSLDCFAPVWNNDKWEMHSYELNIKTANLPELEDFTEESAVLKMNQTGVKINCTLKHNLTNPSSRLVPAILYWEKDGQMIVSSINEIGNFSAFINGSITVTTLTLFPVSHITQGEYHCVARNVRGAARKVFKIFVDDGSSKVGTFMTISSICALSVFVGIVGLLIWRHWSLRMSINRILAR